MPPKAKKGAEPDPDVPLDANGDPLTEGAIAALAAAGGEVTGVIIEDVLDAVVVAVKKRRMDSIVVPYAALLNINGVVNVSSWFAIKPDQGSSEEMAVAENPTKAVDNGWCLEEEPTNPIIDTWARGKVQMKLPKPVDSFAEVEHMKSTGYQSPSAGSIKSSKFGESRSGSRGGKRMHSGNGSDLVPVVCIDIDQEEAIDEGTLRGVKSDAGTLMDGKGQTPAELLAELEASKKAARVAAKLEKERLEAKEVEMQEHLALMKSLSEKNFTYDDDGSLIIIEPLEANKLPPPLGMNIENDIQDWHEPVRDSKGKKPGSKGDGSKGGTANGKPRTPKKKKGETPVFFTVSTVAQPTLISTMTVNAGVSLKEGKKGKAGPEVMGDSSHISRKEYGERKRREEESYYASQQGSNSYIDGLEIGDFDDRTVSSAEDLTVDGGLNMDLGGMSIGMSSMEASPRPEFESRFNDIDSLGGGRRAARKEEKVVSEADDMHDKLISAPDWGNASGGDVKSPAVMGSKPGAKQTEVIKQMSGGPNAKARRDRYQPSAMVPNKDRAHLPAPPLGDSTGHGMAKTIPASLPRGDASIGGRSSRSKSPRPSPRGGGGSVKFPPIDGVSSVGGGSRASNAGSKASPTKGKSRNESILGSKDGGVIENHLK